MHLQVRLKYILVIEIYFKNNAGVLVALIELQFFKFSAVKECPNEYCGKRDVALPKLVDHLVGGDRVPVFIIEEGKPILIPISDEMQKHDIPLPASNCK